MSARDEEALRLAKRVVDDLPYALLTHGRSILTARVQLAVLNGMAWARPDMANVSFQSAVHEWMVECFGIAVTEDVVERADRFIEEALELAQATGWTADRGHALVDYVFGRPVGEIGQEVGGVMVTLSALCNTHGVSVPDETWREIDRITQPDMVLKIREKQASKPVGSALPGASAPVPSTDGYVAAFYEIAAMLGIGAKPYSPAVAFERDIKPRLSKLLAVEGGWRPIQDGDRVVDTIQTLRDVTLRNSHPAWVSDADGRVYEAVWTVDDKGRGYWWDLEGESRVEPVEIFPHPLAGRD